MGKRRTELVLRVLAHRRYPSLSAKVLDNAQPAINDPIVDGDAQVEAAFGRLPKAWRALLNPLNRSPQSFYIAIHSESNHHVDTHSYIVHCWALCGCAAVACVGESRVRDERGRCCAGVREERRVSLLVLVLEERRLYMATRLVQDGESTFCMCVWLCGKRAQAKLWA